MDQNEKALKLHQLHAQGNFLIIANVWDALSTKLIASLGYPVIATASAAIAFSNGYLDGENIPFNQVLNTLKSIANAALNKPVTADIENAYANDNVQLKKHIKQLIETGIVGINIEDTNSKTNKMYSIDEQCERIGIIKKTAQELGINLFINARTDVLLHHNDKTSTPIKELIDRANAYQNSGAHCFFPITLKKKDDIVTVLQNISLPINILTIPGIPDLSTLKEIGVTRISLGPSLLKIAIQSMKSLATELNSLRGLDKITNNEITSDYLKTLILK